MFEPCFDALPHPRQRLVLSARRQNQALSWMWERIEAGLKHNFHAQPQVQAQLAGMCEQVISGQLAPSTAARQLLAIANAESASGLGDSL